MIKLSEEKLVELNEGLNALSNLIAIIYTVAKHEESELGLEGYLNKEFDKIHELELEEDENGNVLRDESGNPITKDIFIISEDEKNRDILKKVMENTNIKSSKDAIELFNKDTKSNVSTRHEAQELVLYHRKLLEPVAQMGRLHESLSELGAKEETLKDIESIYNREIEKLEKFLLL